MCCADAAALAAMTDFYGFPQGCPIMQQLIARSTDAATQPKRLYYVSEGAPLHTDLSRPALGGTSADCSFTMSRLRLPKVGLLLHLAKTGWCPAPWSHGSICLSLRSPHHAEQHVWQASRACWWRMRLSSSRSLPQGSRCGLWCGVQGLGSRV